MRPRLITARPPALPGSSATRVPLIVPSVVIGLALAGLAAWAYAASHEAILLAAALAAGPASVILYRRSIHVSLDAARLALTDRLTGVGNDRRFLERLERDLDRAERTGAPLALCLIDVDGFKLINDRFGHPVGDRVLVQIAGCLRHGGEAFRVGGDEFALLLPGYDEEAAQAVATAVLRRIATAGYGHGGAVTASAGVSVFPGQGLERSALVRAADRALYRAKGDGKDCVRAYRADLADLPVVSRREGADERLVLHRAATGLARAIRARGIERSGHGAGDLAARVAARLGLTAEQVELVRLAATLNDIGKLALPDELLTKPGPLSDDERTAVERHPLIGYQILDSLGADAIATWVLHHHERWDGRGYPEHLAGERIPLAARILFAADAYEAMTTDQAWRPRLTSAEALHELDRCAGTQFDPEVVAAFTAELGAPVREGGPVAVSA